MRFLQLRTRGVRACFAAAAAICLAAFGASPASAAAQSSSQWELTQVDANRSCLLTLRGEEAGTGFHALGAPAGCRKALPILLNAGGWSKVEGGGVRLVARDGGALMDFTSKAPGRFEATGPMGEVYRLSARGGASQRLPDGGKIAQAGAAPARAAPVPVGVAPSRAAIPGRYAILRDESKDTGCMVTLEDRGGRGPKGSSRAFLAPACRDQGLVIFDPVGWALIGGKLTLYANKGHSLSFLVGPDGKTWSKDLAVGGKPIILRRL